MLLFEIFEAKIKDHKAKLHFGKAPATVAGKYLCEVRGEDGQLLSGNMFVYSPPVLRLPTGSVFHEVPDARPPKVIGGLRTANSGGSIELRCPVFAYPQPWVRWERDGKAIGPDPSITYDGDNLILSNVEANMAGTYSCIADNSFPMFVDGPSMPHQLIFEQKFTVNP
ncbi:immunoglobulin domain protein [Necator americanus]|uniref:Immunoglobulin domain protein n=1 Tax=Necator americanus TaxID=51031 RepID=W2TQ14_NECAM|nr:immunoglobulin domain protein [Necator americanus]ETN84170.1 immunoglobulin domain protein [Necator americanus]